MPLPALVADVQGRTGVSTDVGFLATNLLLTVVVVVTFGLTSSLFNSTIKSNREEIDGSGRRRRRAIGARSRWPCHGAAGVVGRRAPGLATTLARFDRR